MLRLTNIKIEGDVAEADFIPEAETLEGHITVDLKTEEITQIKHVPGYVLIYPGHARKKLIALSHETKIPSECTVMWY